jgi:hypothetical protein
LAIPRPFRRENGIFREFGLQNGAFLVVERVENAVLNDFVLLGREGTVFVLAFIMTKQHESVF